MFAKQQMSYLPVALPDRQDLTDTQMQDASDAFYEKMRQRHTVRQFSDRPVPREIIDKCILTAGTAPSGANHQPWHFVAINAAHLKSAIRREAEIEEQKFYAGGAGDEWLKALEPIGTDGLKPHLEIAPWLILVFAQRYGTFDDGSRYKNYYVPESVGIATGLLIAALHHAGLSTLTHTPNPMRFLNALVDRPASEKPVMILAVGHPASDAEVPAVAKIKKPLDEIRSVFEDK